MEKEKQRMAIASACRELWADRDYKWTRKGLLYKVEDGNMTTLDPLTDLNVMAEAKKRLNTKDLRNDYLAFLWDILGLERDSVFWDENNAQGLQTIIIDVTATQEAVAFLKALQLWQDDTHS